MRPLLKVVPHMRAAWLGLYGEQDGQTPIEDVERLAAAAATAPVPTAVIRYPGAGHAFHNADRPVAFQPDAASDGWQRLNGWLDRCIAAP